MRPEDTNLPDIVPENDSAPTIDASLAKPNPLQPVAPVSAPTSLSDIKAEDIKSGPFLEGDTALKRDAILEAGRKLNLHSIEITYDGAGDEGNVDEITACTPAPHPQDPAGDVRVTCPHTLLEDTGPILFSGPASYPSLRELVESFAWDLLEQHYGGFEIDDGAFGTITITMDSGKVNVGHNDRFTTSEYSEAEF